MVLADPDQWEHLARSEEHHIARKTSVKDDCEMYISDTGTTLHHSLVHSGVEVIRLATCLIAVEVDLGVRGLVLEFEEARAMVEWVDLSRSLLLLS